MNARKLKQKRTRKLGGLAREVERDNASKVRQAALCESVMLAEAIKRGAKPARVTQGGKPYKKPARPTVIRDREPWEQLEDGVIRLKRIGLQDGLSLNLPGLGFVYTRQGWSTLQ
jgi:hypothetical protein